MSGSPLVCWCVRQVTRWELGARTQWHEWMWQLDLPADRHPKKTRKEFEQTCVLEFLTGNRFYDF